MSDSSIPAMQAGPRLKPALIPAQSIQSIQPAPAEHASTPPLPPPPPPPPPPKRTRAKSQSEKAVRACDRCSQKHASNCRPSDDDPQRCSNCARAGVACTDNRRPAKSRRPLAGDAQTQISSNGNTASSVGLANNARTASNVRSAILPKWKQLASQNIELMRKLLDFFVATVYPIFPFVNPLDITMRFEKQEHLIDPCFFADVMSICALTSAKVRDSRRDAAHWVNWNQTSSPEDFFAASKETMLANMCEEKALDWIRTSAYLTAYAIQVGNIEAVYESFGLYHNLVSISRMHNEKNWPPMSFVNTELLRRLFWGMYTLEIFSSITWGTIVRCPEVQCCVSYPCEINDEFFTSPSYQHPDQVVKDPTSWIHGWNFVTDLYRLLEHATSDFHPQRQSLSGIMNVSDVFGHDLSYKSLAVVDGVMMMQAHLPAKFRDTTKILSITGPEAKSGLQATNITITINLVFILVLASEDASMDQICPIAEDFMENLKEIPDAYQRATSPLMIHHLVKIGSVIESVMRDQRASVSDSLYDRVQAVLLDILKIIKALEKGRFARQGAADRLRKQITGVDDPVIQFQESENSANYPTISPYISHQNSVANSQPNGKLNVSDDSATAFAAGSDPSIDPRLQGIGTNLTSNVDSFVFDPSLDNDYALQSIGMRSILSSGSAGFSPFSESYNALNLQTDSSLQRMNIGTMGSDEVVRLSSSHNPYAIDPNLRNNRNLHPMRLDTMTDDETLGYSSSPISYAVGTMTAGSSTRFSASNSYAVDSNHPNNRNLQLRRQNTMANDEMTEFQAPSPPYGGPHFQ